MQAKRTRRVPIPCNVDRAQRDGLTKLSQSTRIPRAVLLREAVDDLLKKYRVKVKGKTILYRDDNADGG